MPDSSLAPAGSSTVDDQSTKSPATDSDPVATGSRNLPQALIPLLNNIAENLTESCETDNVTKNTTFLGRNSSATFFRRLSAIHIYDLVPAEISIESAFGLTNRTALHPFGSLWVTVNVKLADILKALPEVETCMR